MLNGDLIPERMPGRRIVLLAELDAAKEMMGLGSYYLGLPIYKMHEHVSPPDTRDEYGGLRNWYRKNIKAMGGVYTIHRSEMRLGLTWAKADAVEYLVTEDEEERAKHEGWREPGNEAIEIAHWIFPANAINEALVPSDFNYEIVIVSVRMHDKEIDRIYYFVKPHEHIITYSHHFRGRRPGLQRQSQP